MDDLIAEPPPLSSQTRARESNSVSAQEPPSVSVTLPAWAAKMRDLFRSGSVAQFILHGNVFDVIPHGDRQLSLKAFLDEAMFAGYDTVLHYDRSRGVRATRGPTTGAAGCSRRSATPTRSARRASPASPSS